MKSRTIIHLAGVVAVLAGVIAGVPGQAQAAPRREPDAPQDIPDTLVSSGVGDYTVAAPKVFWHLRDCVPYIGLAAADNATPDANAPQPDAVTPQSTDVTNLTDSESIRRIAVQGSERASCFTPAQMVIVARWRTPSCPMWWRMQTISIG